MNLFILSSCERENFAFGSGDTDNNNGTAQSEGTLSLASVKLSVVLNSVTITTRATDEGSKVDVSGFYITIKNAGGTQMASWKYSEMPEIFALPVGTYTVEAASVEGVEPSTSTSPYYYGSTSVEIKANTVSEVANLVCSMKSVMVTVEYDDDLKALLDVNKDAVATIYLNNDASTATTFEYGTTTAYYLKAADRSNNTMKATLEATIDGVKISNTATFTNVGQGEHRVIRFHLVKSDTDNNGSGGYATITVTVDATCEVVPVTIDITDGNTGIEDFPSDNQGNDNNTTTPGGDSNGDNNNQGGSNNESGSNGENVGLGRPTITLNDGNDIKTYTYVLSGEQVPISLNISAPNGIAHLYVKIESNTLTASELEEVGITDQFDLAYPGDYKEALSHNEDGDGLGFPVEDDVIGKTQLTFDITKFTGLLSILGTGDHNFILTVEDSIGLSETQTLKIHTN